MDTETQALLVAEVLTMRAEQEAFFNATLATVLSAGGKNPEEVPDAVIKVLKMARETAQKDVGRKLKALREGI